MQTQQIFGSMELWKSDYTCSIYQSFLHCRGTWPTGWMYFCHNSRHDVTTIHQLSQNRHRQQGFSQKVRSDDFCLGKIRLYLHVHMWRSSLSMITDSRLWQKQYVKTVYHRSFFTLKAWQSERGSWRFTSNRRTYGTHQSPVWDYKIVSVVNRSMQNLNPTPLNDTKGTFHHMARLMLYESAQRLSQNNS